MELQFQQLSRKEVSQSTIDARGYSNTEQTDELDSALFVSPAKDQGLFAR